MRRSGSLSLLLLLSFIAATVHAQVRFGEALPLTNTRYGSAPGAPRLVAAGDALYAFWSTGAQLRMSKVVEGERRGGVTILALRDRTYLETHVAGRTDDFDVIWTGTHFVVAATLPLEETIVTFAVDTNAELLTPPVVAATKAYEPELAWNGRTVLMLYVGYAATFAKDVYSLPVDASGRADDLADRVAANVFEKSVASNGSTFAAVVGQSLVTFDADGHRAATRVIPHGIAEDGSAIAGDDVGYLVAVTDGLTVSAFRATASGTIGAPLTIDRIDASPDRYGFLNPAVVWTGDVWVVTYSLPHSLTPTDFHVATVDAGVQNVIARESVVGVSTTAVAAIDGTAFVSWWTSVFPVSAPLYSALPLADHLPQELTFKAVDQTLLTTAHSDSAILVVWSEQADGVTTLRAGTRTDNGEWRERVLAEMYFRPQGQVNRKGSCRRCGLGRSEEAKAVL